MTALLRRRRRLLSDFFCPPADPEEGVYMGLVAPWTDPTPERTKEIFCAAVKSRISRLELRPFRKFGPLTPILDFLEL